MLLVNIVVRTTRFASIVIYNYFIGVLVARAILTESQVWYQKFLLLKVAITSVKSVKSFRKENGSALRLKNQPSFSSTKSKSKVSRMDLKNEVTAPLGTSSKDPIVMPSV